MMSDRWIAVALLIPSIATEDGFAIVGLNVQLSSTSNLYGEAIYNDKSFNGEFGYRYSF